MSTEKVYSYADPAPHTEHANTHRQTQAGSQASVYGNGIMVCMTLTTTKHTQTHTHTHAHTHTHTMHPLSHATPRTHTRTERTNEQTKTPILASCLSSF
mmetsp:Transcript_23969/g.59257  ORF Transcript_23969/g.59257 Transcript_23969/m.59257 type:complete len:99 (+) Transcript_23969:168-464(+)